MKPYTEKTRASSGGKLSISYRDVLAVLQSDQTRSAALTRFRAAGFTADQFAVRIGAKAAMAIALTAVEDEFEVSARRSDRLTEELRAIRDLRRRLEVAVWG